MKQLLLIALLYENAAMRLYYSSATLFDYSILIEERDRGTVQ